MDSNSNTLKRGMFSVLIANIINMIINLITNFVMPKYLSVDSYAAIKTYQLYISYAGVISLGFVDGMFLKYGGIDFDKINKEDLNINLSSFRVFQIAATILMLLGCVVFRDFTYTAFVLTVLPINMTGYFRSLYQSIGEFQRYSKIMNATTVLTFIINICLLFFVKTDSYELYLSLYVILDIVIWLFLEYFLCKATSYKFSYVKFSLSETLINIKDGILLMLGNFSNTILTSMDRWFIKVLLENVDFAQYSFACSMENFVNVAVTPITVTLYNYFCKVDDIEKIKKVRNAVVLFSAALIACAFPGKYILEHYLTNYIEASNVMFFLFCAQFFYIIIKSIYINLYKARHKQKRYFTNLVIVIAAGFLFNVICYSLYHRKESFAIGTMLSAIFWFVLCLKDFMWLCFNLKESLFIVVTAISFVTCGYLFNAILGFVIYSSVVICASLVLMRSDLIFLREIVMSVTKRKRKI